MRETVTNLLEAVAVTIADGQSLSGPVNLGGLRLFGIVMPSTWTAANLSFQMSPDGGNSWVNLYDGEGDEYVVTAGTSRFIICDPYAFAAVPWIQLRSGTAGSPVTQGQNSTVTLILRGV
jgi:hypothetical protein